MPRQKVSYKAKKRHHYGNQFTKVRQDCAVAAEVRVEPTPSPTTSENLGNTSSPKSSSGKKLRFDSYEHFDTSANGNFIFDLTLLSNVIRDFVQCKFCDATDSIQLLVLNDGFESGLVLNFQLRCTECLENVIFKNSKLVPESKLYDTNLKFVYAMRSIGKGLTAGNEFCALLDLPKPPQKYFSYHKKLLTAIQDCAEDSMLRATQEAVEENNGCTDLAVAVDGSWQRRGFKSLNGLVSVTSFDTGKVMDVSVHSKYCHKCTVDQNVDLNHVCTKNYDGTSGGMEIAGALHVFRNSVKRNVRYTKYLGDGDSKGFQVVKDDKPYGNEVEIEKLECIGHIQKRMGRRLRELKKRSRGVKLEDGKVLGGRNRLTDTEIDRLQTYYGLAIRRGVHSVQEMQTNIWAIYFHKLSTNENPQHGLCPKGADSWCRYNKAQAEGRAYNHTNSLPYDVMTQTKDIFRALSENDLLKKCLHGHTQNCNESFNHVVWTKVPKQVFVRLVTLKIGIFDAVLTFNDGHSSRLALYKKLGLSLCSTSVNSLRQMDNLRVKKAEKAAEQMTKQARIARRKRRIMEEEEKNADDPEYGYGLF